MDMLLAMEKLIKATRTYLNNNDQPPKEKSMAVLLADERILKAMQTLEEKPESMQELLLQFSKDLQTLDENSNQLKQEEQEAKFYKNSPIAITPVLPTIEPEDSLSMGDEHLSTILEKELDKVIKSSVENLVPIPSESKDLIDYESECDMPVCDDSSSKNDGLDDIEFAGELAPINPIPPGIVKADLDLEEDIHLIENLLNDDSSPHSLEELNSEIPNAIIESFSPSPIPVEDSDSLMEEIDIFLALDDSIPPGIENDDYDLLASKY
ncbi:hypothetical protein Tco_0590483 [Tanacetum coccineum]